MGNQAPNKLHIVGLTDAASVTPSFSKLGKLSKGELNDNDKPVKLTYFRYAATEGYEDLAKLYLDAYGPEPKSVTIMLMGQSVDNIAWAAMIARGKGGRVNRRCDGQTCYKIFSEVNGQWQAQNGIFECGMGKPDKDGNASPPDVCGFGCKAELHLTFIVMTPDGSKPLFAAANGFPMGTCETKMSKTDIEQGIGILHGLHMLNGSLQGQLIRLQINEWQGKMGKVYGTALQSAGIHEAFAPRRAVQIGSGAPAGGLPALPSGDAPQQGAEQISFVAASVGLNRNPKGLPTLQATSGTDVAYIVTEEKIAALFNAVKHIFNYKLSEWGWPEERLEKPMIHSFPFFKQPDLHITAQKRVLKPGGKDWFWEITQVSPIVGEPVDEDDLLFEGEYAEDDEVVEGVIEEPDVPESDDVPEDEKEMTIAEWYAYVGFTPEEIDELATGISQAKVHPDDVFNAIVEWWETGGQQMIGMSNGLKNFLFEKKLWPAPVVPKKTPPQPSKKSSSGKKG